MAKKKKNKNNNNNRLPVGSAAPTPKPEDSTDQPALDLEAVGAEDEAVKLQVRIAPYV
jgi:hypothetical protein